jgi:hypothetical protein
VTPVSGRQCNQQENVRVDSILRRCMPSTSSTTGPNGKSGSETGVVREGETLPGRQRQLNR